MAQEKKGPEDNVKCSFCGNDSFCDQCKADPSKAAGFEHMCYDCFQRMGGVIPENVKEKTHVCISEQKMQESFEKFMDQMTGRAFAELWNSEKKKLKDLSKQELAEAVFFEGARFMFNFVSRMQADQKAAGNEGEKTSE